MESNILSNSVSVIAICVTVVVLICIFIKFSNSVKVSKDGIEIIKKDTDINIRNVIQESLNDLNVRLDYLTNSMVSQYPRNEYLIRYNVSLIKDLGERILCFNSVSTDEEYIQFRLNTLNTLIDSFGTKMIWNREKIETQFRDWVKNICYLKDKRELNH